MQKTTKSKQGGAVPRNRANTSSKKNKQNNQKIVSAGGVIPNVHMSECAVKYMQTLCDPFGGVTGACIPDSITLPSMKLKTVSRGLFNCGTAGIGIITMNPWTMIVGSGGALNANGCSYPITYTNSAFAGTFWIPKLTNPLPAGVFVAGANSPFDISQLTQSLNQTSTFRLVGAGLRVRYVGTELNRGGRIILHRRRDNSPPVSGVAVTVQTILNDTFYHSVPVDREWKTITYLPARTEDISYGFLVDPSASAANSDYRIISAFIDGAVPGAAFEYEAIAHFELQTSVAVTGGTTNSMTRSHSDPVGFGAIMSALPTTFKEGSKALLGYVAEGAKNALMYATSGVVSVGLRSIGAAIAGTPGSMAGGAVAQLVGPSITEID